MPGEILVPGDLRSGFRESTDVDEVATLRALGVEYIDGAPCRHVFTKEHPRRGGKPWRTIFAMCGASSIWKAFRGNKPQPYPTGHLQTAFRNRSGAASEELDDAIEQIEDAELRGRIKNLLPKSHAEFGRSMAEHRLEAMRMIRKAPEHIKGRTRAGKQFELHHKARDFARRIGADG